MESLGEILSHLQRSIMTCKANCTPLSLTMVHERPWSFQTWNKYSLAVSRAVAVLLHRMNLVSLEKRSTTVRIESKLLESGRSVMKSTLMSTQGIVLG